MRCFLLFLGLLPALSAQAALISELPNTGASNSLLFEVHDTNRGTSASGHLTLPDLAGYISTQGVWNLTLPPWNVSKANSSDQTAAIQAALNASSNLAYHPVCYLPAAEYQIAGTLELGGNIILEGDAAPMSAAATVLRKSGTGPCINLRTASVVRRLMLNGTDSGYNRKGIAAIGASGGERNYWKIEDVRIYAFNVGLFLQYTWTADVLQTYITDCVDGVQISNTVNTIHWRGGEVTGNTNGFHFTGVVGEIESLQWNVQTTIQSNWRAIIATNQAVHSMNFNGCYFEGNGWGNQHVVTLKNTKKIAFTQCMFDNASVTNINLEACYGTTVRDCAFLNSSNIPLNADGSCTRIIYEGNRHDYSTRLPIFASGATYTRNEGDVLILNGLSVLTGSGAPSDNNPPIGSLYLRTDGSTTTTLYVKTGASTWTAK